MSRMLFRVFITAVILTGAVLLLRPPERSGEEDTAIRPWEPALVRS